MTVEELNNLCKNTLLDALSIRFHETSDHEIYAEMPVQNEHKQPFGFLHGGASIALAESLASAASLWKLKNNAQIFAISVNTQHLNSCKEGILIAKADLVFSNEKQHIWDITIKDSFEKTISISRITNRILSK